MKATHCPAFCLLQKILQEFSRATQFDPADRAFIEPYELAGDNAYTLTELAAEISKQAGKEIPYVDIPAADYESALLNAGLPEGLAHLLAQADVDASKGALFSTDKTLSRLLGRPTQDLAVAVKAAL
ncbi:hypothetical protein AAG122_14090 [Raoultella planticola]|uniref:hypothetical protein n=1 Tax=Raoultella planticola TaxID=575 RepID=UPI001BD20BB8|nr:hypothetical protein [Raoultella planticola]